MDWKAGSSAETKKLCAIRSDTGSGALPSSTGRVSPVTSCLAEGLRHGQDDTTYLPVSTTSLPSGSFIRTQRFVVLHSVHIA